MVNAKWVAEFTAAITSIGVSCTKCETAAATILRRRLTIQLSEAADSFEEEDEMLARITLILATGAIGAAGPIILENTIPSGSLFLQPPVLTGAAPLFGGGRVVVADAFTAPVSAALSQISVVVDYEMFPGSGVTGTSPLLLTLLTDNGDSPGTPIENWIVPLLPSDTSLTIVTVNSITNALLLAGDQYWVSVVPTEPVSTGIGWGLTTPGIELPVAESLAGVNAGWLPAQVNLANEFSVSGTAVPEPATLGTGAVTLLLLMIGGQRGKRMRRAFIP
jgi:hypothetical protein